MQIHLKTQAGKTVLIELDPTQTIANIQAVIQEKEGIPIDQQHFVIFQGLSENECPASLQLADGTLISGCEGDPDSPGEHSTILMDTYVSPTMDGQEQMSERFNRNLSLVPPMSTVERELDELLAEVIEDIGARAAIRANIMRKPPSYNEPIVVVKCLPPALLQHRCAPPNPEEAIRDAFMSIGRASENIEEKGIAFRYRPFRHSEGCQYVGMSEVGKGREAMNDPNQQGNVKWAFYVGERLVEQAQLHFGKTIEMETPMAHTLTLAGWDWDGTRWGPVRKYQFFEIGGWLG